MFRRLFVTTALPYANGPFHIGHIMEYIQADIWVRFQRMQGHDVTFIGADDAHGAPIMLAAEKAGKSPEQFIAEIARGRKQYLDGFHIEFDNWHSTHSKENTELSQDIYHKLAKAGVQFVDLKPTPECAVVETSEPVVPATQLRAELTTRLDESDPCGETFS